MVVTRSPGSCSGNNRIVTFEGSRSAKVGFQLGIEFGTWWPLEGMGNMREQIPSAAAFGLLLLGCQVCRLQSSALGNPRFANPSGRGFYFG